MKCFPLQIWIPLLHPTGTELPGLYFTWELIWMSLWLSCLLMGRMFSFLGRFAFCFAVGRDMVICILFLPMLGLYGVLWLKAWWVPYTPRNDMMDRPGLSKWFAQNGNVFWVACLLWIVGNMTIWCRLITYWIQILLG